MHAILGAWRKERKEHLDTAISFKASRRLRFTSVVLPSSVPFILTGMRLGATRALVGVVVAEFLASNAGIGFYINFSGTTLRTDRVMLGVILLGIFGIVVGEVIRRLERRFASPRTESKFRGSATSGTTVTSAPSSRWTTPRKTPQTM